MSRQRLKSCAEHRDFVAGCTPCRDKAARYERQRDLERMRGQVRLIGPTGTRRRLQALAALGWPVNAVAARAQMHPTDVARIMRGEYRQVRTVVAQRVNGVYEQLSMTPGPSTVSRARALAKGYPPPLAWDDETIDDPAGRPQARVRGRVGVDHAAVNRFVAGDRSVRLNNAERREVVAAHHRRGLSDNAIADITGILARQVLRDRQTLGLPPNTPATGPWLEQATA